jgi:2'-5' RNA ligase
MRLFIAVDIPKDITDKIRRTQNQIKKEVIGTFPKSEKLHLTLKFLGEVSEESKDQLINELKKIKFNSFNITLKSIGTFPSENYIRVIWIDAEDGDLPKLAQRINESLKRFKFKKDYNYKTHLTIARVKNIPNKDSLKETLTKFKQKEYGSFTVNSIKLYKSVLKPTGAVYTLIEEFPLT